MATRTSPFIERLVGKEIRRIVKQAAARSGVLSAPEAAAKILRTYPGCGLNEHALADEVMLVAADAGVGVEFGSAPPRRKRQVKRQPQAQHQRPAPH